MSLVANLLTPDELSAAFTFMTTSFVRGDVLYLEQRARGLFCNLACTVDRKGRPKYPQLDMKRFTGGRVGKVLVHHLVWRVQNHFLPIPEDLQVSHLDSEHGYVSCTVETPSQNESRKYCHLFQWFSPLNGELHARCPHLEFP